MRRRIIALIVVMLMNCTQAALAEEAILVRNGNGYDVQVSCAEAGRRYLLVCLKGEAETVEAMDILESSNLLYICQVEAQGDTFSFGGVVPRELTMAGVFIIDSKGNQLYAGAISNKLGGDVDGDGAITESDRALLLSYLAACITLSPAAIEAADMDQSGAIDVFDLKSIDDMLR